MDVIVGVDVGGTNTDAVVLSSDGQVKGKAKVLTSGVDLTGSVCQSITRALNSVHGMLYYLFFSVKINLRMISLPYILVQPVYFSCHTKVR